MVDGRDTQRMPGSGVTIPLETKGLIQNYAENICPHGLLCYTSRYIREMTLLSMRFQLPLVELEHNGLAEYGWIECKGVVIRCNLVVEEEKNENYEVAVYFSEISEKDKSLLKNYVAGDVSSG